MIRLWTWNLIEGGLSILITLSLVYGGLRDPRIMIVLIPGLVLGTSLGRYGAKRVERILEKNGEWLLSATIRLVGPMSTVLFIIGLFLLPNPVPSIVSSLLLPLALLSLGTALLSQAVVYRRWERSDQKEIFRTGRPGRAES